MNTNNYKCGVVAVTGRPNAGKSTIINRLLEQKISIVSPKPQTTRDSINCIIAGDNYQIIMRDTPGVHKPKNKLGEYMMKAVNDSYAGSDCIMLVIDASLPLKNEDIDMIDSLKKVKEPILLVMNKKDKVTGKRIAEFSEEIKKHVDVAAEVAVSAKTGDGMNKLISELLKLMPYGEPLYPEEYLTDRPTRFIASELVREKAMLFLSEEIPYGIGVEIISMKEREGKDLIDIEANILCERNSHKGIIIGKGGTMLKKIGSAARTEIEQMLDCQVNLKLWVKVREDWRNDSNTIRLLGYK